MLFKNDEYQKALQDAETCLSIKPDYVEGFLRKGRALQLLDKFDECINCLSKGLELDSKNKKLMERYI
jgi:stress-induced-phosphoprotein 1